MDLEEEHKLVMAAKSDSESFGRLFDENYDRIFNYCLKRTSSVQVAEDLTSEVFFKALKNLKNFHWQNVPFSAWLYKIAANEINGFFRRGQVTRPVSLEEMQEQKGFDVISPGDASTLVIDKEVAREEFQKFHAISEVLKHLPENYQEALALRYLEKLKVEEVAQVLGKPVGTVKSLLSRGTEMLRESVLSKAVAQP